MVHRAAALTGAPDCCGSWAEESGRRVLDLIDESLESFFRAAVPLSATDVDVSFEPPDREWSAKLTRPTVNLFLWDIRRSATRSRAGVRLERQDGQTVHQHAHPVLRYVVTAWTSSHNDERSLLGGLVRALLSHGAIPRDYLPDAYDRLQVPQLLMARVGEDHIDVFRAVEGQLKPGINMVLTTEFDVGAAVPAGPPAGGFDIGFGDINARNGSTERQRRVAGEVLDPAAVGAVVRSPRDATRVNPAGRFLLRAVEGDEIVVETDPPLVATVPATGGVRLGGPT
jgi:hypothetical protein